MTVPPESLDDAAARLEQIAPGYLERVRARAAELGLPRSTEERVRRSIDLVADSAGVNVDVPTLSRRFAGRVVKRLVAVLVRFYMVFVVGQVRDLGESTSWMGTALFDYAAGLEAELADLRERVGRLERAQDRP